MWKRVVKFLLISVVSIVVISFIGFYIWTQQVYKPIDELDKLVDFISVKDDWLVFAPDQEIKAGIIIYPGAKVDSEAYSYIAQEVSKQGYLVGIPNVRLNLPILDINKADQLIDKYSDINQWYIGGHSLGGVAATSYAKKI